MYFDKRFSKREKTVRKSFEIDDKLFNQLEQYTEIYDANMSQLVGACIDHLLDAPQPPIYETVDPLYVMHTMRLKESQLKALNEWKSRYGISIFRLINLAIQYTLDDDSEE